MVKTMRSWFENPYEYFGPIPDRNVEEPAEEAEEAQAD